MEPLHQCGFIVTESAFRPEDNGNTVPNPDCLKHMLQAGCRIAGIAFVCKNHCIERSKIRVFQRFSEIYMRDHVPPALFTGFPDHLVVAFESLCTFFTLKLHYTPVRFENMEVERTELRRFLYHPFEFFTFQERTEYTRPDRQFR